MARFAARRSAARSRAERRGPDIRLSWRFLAVPALGLALTLGATPASAQGVVRGAQQGAVVGKTIAGPVGAVVGGTFGGITGGIVGGIKGVFGIPQNTRVRRTSTRYR